MIHFVDKIMNIDPNGSLVVVISDKENVFAIDKDIIKYSLHLNAIGFVGKFSSELHDQMDDYLPLDMIGCPITLLLEDENACIQCISESVKFEPQNKVFIVGCTETNEFLGKLARYQSDHK